MRRSTSPISSRTLKVADLRGLKVVIDCANGAASDVAPAVLRGLGAEVVVLHDTPDGRNINEGCGSTSPKDLRRLRARPLGRVGPRSTVTRIVSSRSTSTGKSSTATR